MRTRSTSTLLIAVVAACALLGTAAPSHAGPAQDESSFVSKINAERSRRGISKLSVKSDLVAVARRHSARMAAKGDIWHNPNLAREVGGGWSELGENVGVGPDVTTLHNAFMNSKSHRDNILRRSYNEVGSGVAYGEDGLIYVTVVFARRNATTTKKTTTTTSKTTAKKTSSAPAASTTSSPSRATTASAPPSTPAASPKPVERKPEPAAPQPRTVDLLERMLGLDGGHGSS